MTQRLSHHMLRSSLAGLLTVGLCAPAVAVQNSQSNGQQQNQSQRDTRDSRQRDRSGQTGQDRSQQSGQQSSGGAQVQVQPEGWIRIGVDRDGDGQFEAVETIFVYDLDVAQERSRQRQQNGSQQRAGQDAGQDHGDRESRSADQDRPRRAASARQDRMSRASENRNRQDRQNQRFEIEGTVRELTTMRIPGHDEQFLFARIRNNQGRTGRVLLGAKSELEQLDLDTGDRVSVAGSPATVNDQVMLIARRVEANGDTVRPQSASRASQSRSQNQSGQSDQWNRNRSSEREGSLQSNQRGQQDESQTSQRSRYGSSGQEDDQSDSRSYGRNYGQDDGRSYGQDD